MPAVRKARPADFPEIAQVLHLSAAEMYDRFSGGRARALRALERSLAEPGTASSAEVVYLVERRAEIAGAMAAFPVAEALARSRGFLRLAVRGAPPWHWPTSLWLYWTGGRLAPNPPPSAFYVDALATAPSHRRSGVARALLDEAERQARERGLKTVALDTALSNEPARSLYRSAGYDEVAYRPPGRGLPGFVALVKNVS